MARVNRPRVVLFDCYNTLLETQTDEHSEQVWQQLACFLAYQNLHISANALCDLFFMRMKHVQQTMTEEYPEINMAELFRDILTDQGFQGTSATFNWITQLFRMLTIRRLQPFADTISVLEKIQHQYQLGIISDAQRLFIKPELTISGLDRFFEVQIISGDYGYRKPDARLFQHALHAFQAEPADVVYIGDNIYRDIYGAQGLGITGIWIKRHSYQERDDITCIPDHTCTTLQECADWLEQLA